MNVEAADSGYAQRCFHLVAGGGRTNGTEMRYLGQCAAFPFLGTVDRAHMALVGRTVESRRGAPAMCAACYSTRARVQGRLGWPPLARLLARLRAGPRHVRRTDGRRGRQYCTIT